MIPQVGESSALHLTGTELELTRTTISAPPFISASAADQCQSTSENTTLPGFYDLDNLSSAAGSTFGLQRYGFRDHARPEEACLARHLARKTLLSAAGALGAQISSQEVKRAKRLKWR